MTFSERNRQRCESFNGFDQKLSSWSSSDWMTALTGEVGEAANIIKKLNRIRDNIKGNTETKEELEQSLGYELADIYIYLDLLAQSLGRDLMELVEIKFNLTSKKIGYENYVLD